MKIDRDTWEEVVGTITSNKSRSFLTAFGIFWGIFMLVTIIGGSNGFKMLMSSTFDGFATNAVFLLPNRTGESYKGFNKGRRWEMNMDDCKKLDKVPGIYNVVGALGVYGIKSHYNDFSYNANLIGVFPEQSNIQMPVLKNNEGRYINQLDMDEKRRVCVLGKRVAEMLFPGDAEPVGKYIEVDGNYFKVIGVDVSESNMNLNGSGDRAITIPISTIQQLYPSSNTLDYLSFLVSPGYSSDEVSKEAEQVLKHTHLIAPNDKEAVICINTQSMFQMMDNLFKGIAILTWLVGIGTLLAGVIGVSNIMMVTIKERTTEIGIRRAIGAQPVDILGQILLESMVLTLLAGIIGILFSVIILQMVEMGVNMSAHAHYIPFQVSFGMAFGTSILLLVFGALAGLFPAMRAMKIKPIEAIRDDE